MDTCTKPGSDGTTSMTLAPLALGEKLAAIVSLPPVPLGRDAGCGAPQSTRREAMIPTPRQQGVAGEEAKPGTPSWSWARLLGRVVALARARGDPQDAPPAEARGRPAAACPCPCAPRNVRWGCRSLRRRAGLRWRRARSDGVAPPSERLPSRWPSAFPTALPAACPPGHR